MALKLGELLIKEGLITNEQLEEALKCQVIFGIKLGSSLIELGMIDEKSLVRLLSKKLGVPAATHKDLQDLFFSTYGLLSAAVAEKHRVIPFKLDNRRLSVAMSDPTDFKAIDELAFVTGYIIQPYIVPDMYISHALAKYYQVRCDMRYLQVGSGFKRNAGKPDLSAAPAVQNIISVTYEKDDGELLNIEIPAEFEGFGNLPDLPDEPGAPQAQFGRYTIDQLSLDFAAARERDEVADVFIKYLGQDFEKGALFIIRGKMAVGWRAIIKGATVDRFDEMAVELAVPSVLNSVIKESRFSMGPVNAAAGNRPIAESLKLSPHDTLLAIPVIMLNKIVAIVLVSADVEALGQKLQELQKLVYKASLAFEMLIIRNKILMT
ncbi:MAG: hypothetical protein A2X80_06040 [Geobacteraceae bacterium GWB2_52_12]|nr:MAG: hypothetical protein A2X80_06040 [Geobacteraceae bacterium GWB2_52_12]